MSVFGFLDNLASSAKSGIHATMLESLARSGPTLVENVLKAGPRAAAPNPARARALGDYFGGARAGRTSLAGSAREANYIVPPKQALSNPGFKNVPPYAEIVGSGVIRPRGAKDLFRDPIANAEGQLNRSVAKQYLIGARGGRQAGGDSPASLLNYHTRGGPSTADLDFPVGELGPGARFMAGKDTTPVPGSVRLPRREVTAPVRIPAKKKIYGGPQAQVNAEAREQAAKAKYAHDHARALPPQAKAQGKVGRKLNRRRKPGPVLSATGGAPTSGRSSGGWAAPKTPPMAASKPGKPPRSFFPTWDRIPHSRAHKAPAGAPAPPKRSWPGPKGRRKVPRYARKEAARVAGLPAPPQGLKTKAGGNTAAAVYGSYKGGSKRARAHLGMAGVQAKPRPLVPSLPKRPKRPAPPQSWSRRNRNALGVLGAGTLGASVLAGNAYQGRSRRHPTARTPQIPGGMPY